MNESDGTIITGSSGTLSVDPNGASNINYSVPFLKEEDVKKIIDDAITKMESARALSDIMYDRTLDMQEKYSSLLEYYRKSKSAHAMVWSTTLLNASVELAEICAVPLPCDVGSDKNLVLRSKSHRFGDRVIFLHASSGVTLKKDGTFSLDDNKNRVVNFIVRSFCVDPEVSNVCALHLHSDREINRPDIFSYKMWMEDFIRVTGPESRWDTYKDTFRTAVEGRVNPEAVFERLKKYSERSEWFDVTRGAHEFVMLYQKVVPHMVFRVGHTHAYVYSKIVPKTRTYTSGRYDRIVTEYTIRVCGGDVTENEVVMSYIHQIFREIAAGDTRETGVDFVREYLEKADERSDSSPWWDVFGFWRQMKRNSHRKNAETYFTYNNRKVEPAIYDRYQK